MGSGSAGEDAGIEDAVGVERVLDGALRGQVGGRPDQVEPRGLGDADAVLGRDRPAPLGDRAEDGVGETRGVGGVEKVEVGIPFGQVPCAQALEALGLVPELRLDGDVAYRTDNGNYILDCKTGPLERPDELEAALRAIPGVVGTGLFLNMNPTVLVGHADRVEIRGAK